MIDGTFRFNPLVDLVLYDRLSAADRARFEALARDPAFYGVLVAPTGAKALDRDSALVLLTLRTPGPIPRYVVRALGDEAERRIAGWVLDGILEVERDGVFLSGAAGAAAMALLDDDIPVEGAIGRLSIAAIRSAAALPTRDAAVIAGRLYRANQVPLSPRYARRHGLETDDDRLGLAVPRATATLARSWTRLPASNTWVQWVSRHTAGRATYKLYVSPVAAAVRQVFPDAVAAVTPLRPCALKVGRGLYGLLRPDKMVIYFAERDDLHAAASAVADALAGAPAHGTPFTSTVTADGLLSWGVDPPDDQQSWRERLANQIAAALVAAPDTDAVPYVLARLEAHGVNVRTWSPAA
jgi:hypothetical protein